MAWYDDIVDALTTSADTEASEPVVSRGDQGEEIKDIQQRLIDLGYDLGKSGADGVFGLNTEKGFQKFQGDFNLPQTGLATGPTLDAIFAGGIPLETVEGETPLPTTPNVNSSNLVPTDNATYFANGDLLPPESEDETIVVEDEDVPQTSTPSAANFATITKNGKSTVVVSTAPLESGFESLSLAEGTNIHLDGRGFVTLPHGIVPDKNSIKKADGTSFDPTGKHGLKAGNLGGVDFSGATKYGISRSAYSNDEAWAKAVYAEFGDRTAVKYGTGFDTLSDPAKQAAFDMTWNAGIGAADWSSVRTMLKEASKSSESDKTTANLIGFTTNFKSGSDYPRGLLKRRVQTYNLVAKAGEEATTITTSAVSTNGTRTGTKYDVKKSDGTVLKTWTKPDNNERLGNLDVS